MTTGHLWKKPWESSRGSTAWELWMSHPSREAFKRSLARSGVPWLDRGWVHNVHWNGGGRFTRTLPKSTGSKVFVSTSAPRVQRLLVAAGRCWSLLAGTTQVHAHSTALQSYRPGLIDDRRSALALCTGGPQAGVEVAAGPFSRQTQTRYVGAVHRRCAGSD